MAKRAFEQAQLRTKYRGWQLIATSRTVTGKKGIEHFEIARLPNIEDALRAGRRKVDRLEGEEVWNENYQAEALQ